MGKKAAMAEQSRESLCSSRVKCQTGRLLKSLSTDRPSLHIWTKGEVLRFLHIMSSDLCLQFNSFLEYRLRDECLTRHQDQSGIHRAPLEFRLRNMAKV